VRIAPVPLVLSPEQNLQIHEACDQWVRVLSCLFEDVVLGKQRVLRSQAVLPQLVLDSIFAPTLSLHELRKLWHGRSVANLTFPLGPDIVLDKKGDLHLLELNVGNLGGIADMHHVPARFLEAAKQHLQLKYPYETVRWNHLGPMFFIDPLCEAQSINRPKTLMLAVAPELDSPAHKREQELGVRGDLEEYRFSAALRREQIKLIEEPAEGSPPADSGTLVLNRWTSPGLREWWLRGTVSLLTPPGVEDFLGNKLLLAYLNRLIRFYLSETPKIAVPDAQVFEFTPSGISQVTDGRSRLNPSFTSQSGLVIKSARGSSGEEVVIFPPGSTVSHRDVINAIPAFWDELVAPNTGRLMLAQRFVDLGVLDNCKYDMRPFVYCIGSKLSTVADLPHGRAMRIPEKWTRGERQKVKVNVAQGAHIMPVFQSAITHSY
jgi:hypothetical protein